MKLPSSRVLSKAFAERGREGVVLIDGVPVGDGQVGKLVFVRTNSNWRQGVWLATDRGLWVNGVLCPSARIWADNSPAEVEFRCSTSNGVLWVYNIWDAGKGPDSQAWSSGMLVEPLGDGAALYRCNDIGFETEFDKVVFSIKLLPLG